MASDERAGNALLPAADSTPGQGSGGLIDLHTTAIALSLPDLEAVAPWGRWPSVAQRATAIPIRPVSRQAPTGIRRVRHPT